MKTIQELIGFFEAIPAEKWTKRTLSSLEFNKLLPEQNCAFGHLNKHLLGTSSYDDSDSITDCSSWKLVRSLDIHPADLINANNNGPDDAKTNVISFLKEIQKELA